MAKRRRKKSRRSNPEYSDAVYDLVNEFSDALDKAANAGYKAAKRIQIKAGDVKIASMCIKIADAVRDASEALEDELGD